MLKDLVRRGRLDYHKKPLSDDEIKVIAWHDAAMQYAELLARDALHDKGIILSSKNFVYEDAFDDLVWRYSQSFYMQHPLEP